MFENNIAYLNKHRDILSFRDLAKSTVTTYISYLTTYIEWVEEQLPGRLLSSVTWEEIRSYVKWLKDVRGLNPRTINVHIAQLRDFFYYVLHKDWDKREVPYLHFDQFLPNVPTKEQVNAIIDSISNPKHKAEIALLYSSGIRVSELCRVLIAMLCFPTRHMDSWYLISGLLIAAPGRRTGCFPGRRRTPISVSSLSITSSSAILTRPASLTAASISIAFVTLSDFISMNPAPT